MSGFRFSIAAVLALTLFAGLVFGALRSGATIWFQSIYTLTFVILLFAAIAARYRGAFWYGFAIVGWAYFVLGFGPWNYSGGYALSRGLLISSIAEKPAAFLQDERLPTKVRDEYRLNRVGVCQISLTIPLALVGGVVSVLVASGSRMKAAS